MLVVGLQAVGSHGTKDGPDAANAQRSSQEAGVEQNLLIPSVQLVGHVMSVDVEVFKGKRHHWQHGCAYNRVQLQWRPQTLQPDDGSLALKIIFSKYQCKNMK